MRIVLTSPDGLTKEGLITTYAELRQTFPQISWAGFPSDAQLQELNLPARVSVETDPPTVAEFGEQAVADDERQPDGTWQQVWSIVPTITLEEAKAQLAALAIELYWRKTVLDQPTVVELTSANADPAAVLTARRDKYRPTLLNVRNAILAAATVAECWELYKTLRDAS
jgi:hypothetical protein